jgi:hypothetical protein
MNEVIFKKDSDGNLFAANVDGEPIRNSDGKLMSPAEYYRSVNFPAKDWPVEMRVEFIKNCGGEEYKKVFQDTSRNPDDTATWTSSEKSRYIAKHGREAYMQLFRRSGLKGSRLREHPLRNK